MSAKSIALWVLGLSFGLVAGCAEGRNMNACDPACASTQECCMGTCVFRGLCGATPMDSGTTPGTDGGGPSGRCPEHQLECGGICVNRSVPPNTNGTSDPSFSNCNGCGITCDPMRANSCSVPGGGAGLTRCMCGDFDQCISGEACVNEAGFYRCISMSTDPNNCGAIGNRCAMGESCVGGMCVCGASGRACGTGQACCSGSCIDTQSDPMNCGACGNVCSAQGPECVTGSCACPSAGRLCAMPMAGVFGMGGSPGESCCPGMGCVANTRESCNCMPCAEGDECAVGSDLLGMTGAVEVCCGDPFIIGFMGCGGGGFPTFP
ncbi:MAG: hypothetical protein KF729_06965 [Sandaracinaceae bacterium]|nr:hypothetical protein [Sandaracinaceae bacterium]